MRDGLRAVKNTIEDAAGEARLLTPAQPCCIACLLTVLNLPAVLCAALLSWVLLCVLADTHLSPAPCPPRCCSVAGRGRV